MINESQLSQFCNTVSNMLTAHFAETYKNLTPPAVSFEKGKKYARIVTEEGDQRSAYCFVRLEDGVIMKADSWATPAKGIRGNIANGAADVTPYGARYLR